MLFRSIGALLGIRILLSYFGASPAYGPQENKIWNVCVCVCLVRTCVCVCVCVPLRGASPFAHPSASAGGPSINHKANRATHRLSATVNVDQR